MATYDEYKALQNKLKSLGDRYWDHTSGKPGSAPRCQCFNCIGVRTIVDQTCDRLQKFTGCFSSANFVAHQEDVERVKAFIYDIAIERLQECWEDVSKRPCERKPKPRIVA